MIMSKIAKVREIVSHLIANESIVNYLSKSTAIQIQKVAKEGKRDCFIFFVSTLDPPFVSEDRKGKTKRK